MPRKSLAYILILNAYWVGLSFMWNGLHVIILPAVLLHLVPDAQKNTYLGLLTFAGLVIAALLQPLAGALSDRWVSRWGRRRPLIVLGTAFDFVFLAALGWAGGLGWLILGYLGLQVSSNFAHGSAQGLLPDIIPPEQLGAASGLKNLMDMGGLVISSLLVGRLLSPDTQHPVVVVGLIAFVLALGTAVTVLGAKEPAASPTPPSNPHPAGRVSLRAFLDDFHAHPDFWWLIVSRFAYLAGIYGIQTFAQYYVRDVLAMPNPVQATGDLLAAIALALMAFAIGGGWLGDRFGHKQMLTVACVISAMGSILLLWARTYSLLLMFGAVLGAGIGLFLTANWALATTLAPRGEAGKYLGLTNLATAGAGALGRLEGPMLDALNNARPGAWWGYTVLFGLGVVGAAVSVWLLRRVHS
jgi:MFS family permease